MAHPDDYPIPTFAHEPHVIPGATAFDAGAMSAGDKAKLDSIANPAPTVTGFSPGSGHIGAGVTVTGTNFLVAVTDVKVGLVSAAFTIVDNNTLTLIVPVGAATGKISVTNSGGTGQSAANFVVI